MLEWLTAAIDIARPHDISFEVSWHGRLMVLSWSFLVPLGVLSARFFKVLPGQNWPQVKDSKVWWNTHLIAQYTSAILVITAMVLIWDVSGTRDSSFLHHFVGWTTLGLCSLQFLAGWFRGSKGGPSEVPRTGTIRGDHFDMTPRRKAFEHFHKYVGYFCLLCSLVAVISGLWLSNAPRWMWIIITLWWCLVFVGFYKLQKHRGALDTYQAIWGTDSSLPGNQTRPIGISVKRHQEEQQETDEKSIKP